jgi:hypothetical protein
LAGLVFPMSLVLEWRWIGSLAPEQPSCSLVSVGLISEAITPGHF